MEEQDKSSPVLSNPTRIVRLDLACGKTPKEGFDGVDLLAPNAKYKVDLLKFPWMWESDSIDEIHCSHFVEHISCREVEHRDLASENGAHLVGKDMFFAFFDECWRILKKTSDPANPLGKMTVIVPAGRSNRAFQDPTHRRFLVAETFLYLNREWRKMNNLDHYRVDCHFGVSISPTVPTELTTRHQEWQQLAFNHYWNTVIDFHATLIAMK